MDSLGRIDWKNLLRQLIGLGVLKSWKSLEVESVYQNSFDNLLWIRGHLTTIANRSLRLMIRRLGCFHSNFIKGMFKIEIL